MKDELISVVVPIYNVEQYIEECIDSIINQTYKKIEIILVDDGSPDNCGIICDEYAKKDKRINVIHKKNGGLSDARNYGIDNAKGKYIVFIDSDDYVESSYIEKLYMAIKENKTMIAQCNIIKVNNEKQIIEKIGYDNNQIKSGKEMITDMCNEHWIENVVSWNKLYSIDLFNDLRYPNGKIHEDEFITYKILYKVSNVAIINNYLYNYRQTRESIVGKKFNIKRLDVLEALEKRVDFFKEIEEKELYELSLKCYLHLISQSYVKTRLYINNSKGIQKNLIKKYKEYYKCFLRCKKIKTFIKLKMAIFYISPSVFYLIKKENLK